MKTTVKMKDLKKQNGFPGDVDRSQKAALLIHHDSRHYALLYQRKNGNLFVFNGLTDILWQPGIYWIEPQ